MSYKKELKIFENNIADYLGISYATSFSTARQALLYGLYSSNVSKGDEVIIPDFMCEIIPLVIYASGATPRFCDVKKDSFELDLKSLENSINSKTRAILVSNLFGIPSNFESIQKIVNDFDLIMIDDASQAFGAEIHSHKIGTRGNFGIISLRKTFSLRVGAIIVSNNKVLNDQVLKYRETYEQTPSIFMKSLDQAIGFVPFFKSIYPFFFKFDWQYLRLKNKLRGYRFNRRNNGWFSGKREVIEEINNLWIRGMINYPLIEEILSYDSEPYWLRRLCAVEIEKLTKELELVEQERLKRKSISDLYDDFFLKKGINKVMPPPDSKCSYFMYPLLLDADLIGKALKNLNQHGIIIKYRYKALHKSPFFSNFATSINYENSILLESQILPLPLNSKEQAKHIILILNDIL